jgi:hypothetical protein
MHIKVKHAARAELADAVRRRYRLASGKEKHTILDESGNVCADHVSRDASCALPFAEDRVLLSLFRSPGHTTEACPDHYRGEHFVSIGPRGEMQHSKLNLHDLEMSCTSAYRDYF